MNFRIGHGYDAHRLTPDRALILGGVEIPYERGLLGHSDADVLTHAVIDAILGALAMGDIGTLFPDSDPAYKGISSLKLLAKVRMLMEDMGWEIGNLDATVVAQAPKLKPYIEQMRAALAHACACCRESIKMRATAGEQVGFTGSGGGICAHAVCLLSRR